MIYFPCPHCGEAVEVDDTFAGRQGRCPGCRGIVDIPPAGARARAAAPGPAAKEEPAGPSVFGPDLAAHGPRTMKLPDSVQGIDLDSQPQQQPVPTAGPVSAVTAMVLAFLPCVSVLGIIFGGIAWSRARQAEPAKHLHLAIAATVLAIASTILQLVLGMAVCVATVQVSVANGTREQCGQIIEFLGYGLNSAMSSGDNYPEQMTGYSSGGYSYGERCPQSGLRFSYIGGLKYDAGSKVIILYDPAPEHGYRTWLRSQGNGRSVFRMDGRAEFLTEAEFQKEMADQSAKLGLPWPQ